MCIVSGRYWFNDYNLPCAHTVHMRSQNVIFDEQITHTYRQRINEELYGHFFVNVAAII